MAAFFVMSALSLPGHASSETIRVGGTGSALGTMKLIAAAFEKEHPGASVTIYPSMGSSGAIQALVAGSIDIALTSRPLKLDELKHGLAISVYARTPMVLASGRSTETGSLSTEELVEIISGRKTTWPDGKRIRLVLRPANDTDMLLIRGISPEFSAALDQALARPGMLIAATDQDAITAIATSPGALGFTTLSLVLTDPSNVQIHGINGVKPTLQTVADGAYPVVKPLHAVTRAYASPLIRSFIAFLRSPEARKILVQTGNVAVSPAGGR